MFEKKKTNSCASLAASDEGKEVVLMGWVDRRRDHGQVVFVDLRDREGVTQVVFNPERDADTHLKAKALRAEFVIAVSGTVIKRSPELVNPNLETGEIEVMVGELEILSESRTTPFP